MAARACCKPARLLCWLAVSKQVSLCRLQSLLVPSLPQPLLLLTRRAMLQRYRLLPVAVPSYRWLTSVGISR